MNDPSGELARRVSAIALNRDSGASAILDEVVAILTTARDRSIELLPLARLLTRAQPSMAPVWNAVLAALASDRDPERFGRFVRQVARAPDALRRFAIQCVALEPRGTALHLVTISMSRAVLTVMDAARTVRDIRVSCSESRPALEGRHLASRLAAEGVPVTCFSDAAIGEAIAAADAVVVGADAIGPEWFINKTGTRMLAAAAHHQGIPVWVAATRDKFVGPTVAARLTLREGSPAEIWDAPPPGVEVRNPYFETIPLDLVTLVISNAGLLGAALVPDVCGSLNEAAILDALERLGG